MATTDELLAEALAEEESSVEYFDIDADARTITVPANEALFGVYSDKDVERKYFRCPRVVGDGIDLSTCYIFINYTSASGKAGMYAVEDLTYDDSYIYFSWLLSGNVFDKNAAGTVSFAVQAKTLEDDGETLKNRWNTTTASGTTKATIEGETVVEETYADVISQILAKVSAHSRVEMTADDTEATLSPNTLYVFPEMSALAITLADPEDTGIVNEYHFIFTSGETATELSIPDTIDVGSLSIAASTTYEISIVEGLLAYQSWEVG